MSSVLYRKYSSVVNKYITVMLISLQYTSPLLFRPLYIWLYKASCYTQWLQFTVTCYITIISYWGVYHYRSMAGLLLCSTDSHFVAYFILYCWVLKINYYHYLFIHITFLICPSQLLLLILLCKTINQLKHCLLMINRKMHYSEWGHVSNTTLGFALNCICNSTPPLILYFLYISYNGALTCT